MRMKPIDLRPADMQIGLCFTGFFLKQEIPLREFEQLLPRNTFLTETSYKCLHLLLAWTDSTTVLAQTSPVAVLGQSIWGHYRALVKATVHAVLVQTPLVADLDQTMWRHDRAFVKLPVISLLALLISGVVLRSSLGSN